MTTTKETDLAPLTHDELLFKIMPQLRRDENVTAEDYDRLQFLSVCFDEACDFACEWAEAKVAPFRQH